MSVTTPSTTSTTNLKGQALFDAFIVELRSYLREQAPQHTLQGSKEDIVARVIEGSARLHNDVRAPIADRLYMAVNAPCREHLRMRMFHIRGDQYRVVLV